MFSILTVVTRFPEGVIVCKICFDFFFYDLTSISDCLITNYSSVGYDYMPSLYILIPNPRGKMKRSWILVRNAFFASFCVAVCLTFIHQDHLGRRLILGFLFEMTDCNKWCY